MILIGLILGAVFVTPVVLVYVLVIKGIDRYEPEPWWLLVGMFLWGATAAVILGGGASLVAEGLFTAVTGLGHGQRVSEIFAAVAAAPLMEESAKGLGLLILRKLLPPRYREIDGPLDGVIYGGMAGLGFTLTEDVLYVASAMAENGAGQFAAVFILRTVLAGLGHASFTALTGLGIGLAVESRRRAAKVLLPLAGLTGAVALHATHNAIVTVWSANGGGLLIKLLLFWGIDGLYFMLMIGLVLRDRRIVIAGLYDEVGRLIHPHELAHTASLWMLVPLWNYFDLKESPGGYRRARRKQLDLVELAFLKHRLRRGEQNLEALGQELVQRIMKANRQGVLVGRS